MHPGYLFTSQRMGFRTWRTEDLASLQEINANSRVMRYFPKTLSLQETKAFLHRMQQLHEQHGHCYFALEHLESKQFMGFIGIGLQEFEASFTPVRDLGWRLAPDFWRQGYAKEGAKRCIQFAKDNLGFDQIYAMAPESNLPSIGVMKSIGMKKVLTFEHPALLGHPQLRSCALYRIGL